MTLTKLSIILAIIVSILTIIDFLFNKLAVATQIYLFFAYQQIISFILLGAVLLGIGIWIGKYLSHKRMVSPVIAVIRQKPIWALSSTPIKYERHGVLWHVFAPPFYSFDQQPWAEGPFCPKCYRESDSENSMWICPMCKSEFPKPRGDLKEEVEKDLAAYLRKRP